MVAEEERDSLREQYEAAIAGYPTPEELAILGPHPQRIGLLAHIAYLMQMRDFNLPLGEDDYVKAVAESVLMNGETGLKIHIGIRDVLKARILERSATDPAFRAAYIGSVYTFAESEAFMNPLKNGQRVTPEIVIQELGLLPTEYFVDLPSHQKHEGSK